MSERRPLRRRLETIARPARVRIRSRKPCTRARRRLFGWKVRLPFATALSSSHLASHSAHLVMWVGRDRPHEAFGRLCVSVVTGAGPGRMSRIAAVSPTFGRLFEGTDEASPGQTCSRATAPHPEGRSRPGPNPSSILHCFHTRHGARRNLIGSPANVAEWLALARKTVSFGRCSFQAVPDRNGPRQRSEDGGSAHCPGNLMLAVDSADFACRRRQIVPR